MMIASTGFPFFVLVLLVTHASCSPSPRKPTESDVPEEKRLDGNFRTNTAVPAEKPIIPIQVPSKPTSSNQLTLVEVLGNDKSDREIAKGLLQRNPRARQALMETKEADSANPLESQSLLVTNAISESDIRAVEMELAKLKGYRIDPGTGIAINYGRVVIAIVGGYLDEDYSNAYLIRIPGRGWMFLETMEVPPPMRTPGRW